MSGKQEVGPLDAFIIDYIKKREEGGHDPRPFIHDTPADNPDTEPDNTTKPPAPKIFDEQVYGNRTDDDEETPGVNEVSIDELLEPRDDDEVDEGGD